MVSFEFPEKLSKNFPRKRFFAEKWALIKSFLSTLKRWRSVSELTKVFLVTEIFLTSYENKQASFGQALQDFRNRDLDTLLAIIFLEAQAAWSSGIVSACHRGNWSYGP
jgi:hypothetical protein